MTRNLEVRLGFQLRIIDTALQKCPKAVKVITIANARFYGAELREKYEFE